MLLVQEGNGDAPAADLHVVGDDREHVLLDDGVGNVVGDGCQTRFVQQNLDFIRRVAVEARELHRVVAQRLELFEHARQIPARVLAGGIELITDQCLFHDAHLIQSSVRFPVL